MIRVLAVAMVVGGCSPLPAIDAGTPDASVEELDGGEIDAGPAPLCGACTSSDQCESRYCRGDRYCARRVEACAVIEQIETVTIETGFLSCPPVGTCAVVFDYRLDDDAVEITIRYENDSGVTEDRFQRADAGLGSLWAGVSLDCLSTEGLRAPGCFNPEDGYRVTSRGRTFDVSLASPILPAEKAEAAMNATYRVGLEHLIDAGYQFVSGF